MVAARLLVLGLLVGAVAGCRLEAPEAPSLPAPEALASESRPVPPEPPRSSDLPSAPTPPTVPEPAPRPDTTRSRPELVVTIGGEVLRLDAEAVRAVERREDPYTQGATLVLLLRPDAAERFAAMTGANLGKQAIVTLDGRVLTSLSIQDRIVGGRFPIPVEADEVAEVEAQIRAATRTLPTV